MFCLKFLSLFYFMVLVNGQDVAIDPMACYEPDNTAPLYVWWSQQITDHMYTVGTSELGGKPAWKNLGIEANIFTKPLAGTVPLRQFWYNPITDHFFTDQADITGLTKGGWQFQKVVGYVDPEPNMRYGTVPFYRYWHEALKDHYLTTTKRTSGVDGWMDNGIAGYICPKDVSSYAGEAAAANANGGGYTGGYVTINYVTPMY